MSVTAGGVEKTGYGRGSETSEECFRASCIIYVCLDTVIIVSCRFVFYWVFL